MLNLRRTEKQRNDRFRFLRSRFLAVALLISAAALCVGVWPLKLIQIGAVGQNNARQAFTARQINDQIRRGIGRQVRFASSKDSPEKVGESVWQVSKFVYERSGLKMSSQTRERLIGMESRALGDGRRVGLEALTDALTETALDRMSTLTDQEIEQARNTFLADGQTIRTRASGGSLLAPERFVEQARAFRVQAQLKDQLLRDEVRGFIATEVATRAALLADALPEDFGGASKNGITPLQAVVFTYSVASDDQLNGSQGELQETVSRINEVRGRQGAKAPSAERAYGVNGRVLATPINVLFNPTTIKRLLDRIEKGGAK
jgi:hypothetical protein